MSAGSKLGRAVRQLHRWVSVAFTVAVVANLVALGRDTQAVWVGVLALLPLVLLLLTGVYLFVQPYLPRSRAAQTLVPGSSQSADTR
jgi:amino acid permease